MLSGGWIIINELLSPQSNLFTELNDAIEIFWTEVVNLGLENNVVLYTASDFDAPLTSNGSGSMLGVAITLLLAEVRPGVKSMEVTLLWLAAQMIWDEGRILPSTSVDAYMAELTWYGVPSSEISTVIPNINNFNFA